MWFLALGLVIALTAAGCYVVPACPTEPSLKFYVEDGYLKLLFHDAVQAWTDAGLVNAGRVTYENAPGKDVISVKWQTEEEAPHNCDADNVALKPGQYIGGCSVCHAGGVKDNTLWITRLEWKLDDTGVDVSESHYPDEKRIRPFILHEIIHLIVPVRDHLPQETPGIMNAVRTVSDITEADLTWLATMTEVA